MYDIRLEASFIAEDSREYEYDFCLEFLQRRVTRYKWRMVNKRNDIYNHIEMNIDWTLPTFNPFPTSS